VHFGKHLKKVRLFNDETLTTTTEIVAVDLHNLLQDSGIQKLVLDVRDLQHYKAGFIRTALHFDISGVLHSKNLNELVPSGTLFFLILC
jgi:rhodanese-related sulfurtransferase